MTGTPVYLGTCQAAPKIRWDPAFEPIMNDISGSRKPFDFIYEGMDAMVIGDLTVFNWAVWEQIKSLPNHANPAGTQLPGDIGTMMVTEGFAYPLWVHYPYATKAALAAAGMPAGRRFVAAWLMGPIDEDPGTKQNTFHIQFYCAQAYDKTTGRFICSDATMTGIPSIPPVSPLGF